MIDKKIAIFLAIILAIPNVTFACAGGIFYNLMTWVLLILLLIFLVIVLVKSVARKKIYRGRLNIVLLAIIILIFIMLGYKEYNFRKEVKECEKKCIDQKIPCFCNKLSLPAMGC